MIKRNRLNKFILLLVFCFFCSSIFAAPKKNRPTVALVLAGGGAKGFAHIPILEKLEELGIPVDLIIGTSAGAIVGGLYCAGWSTENLSEMLINLNWSEIFQDAVPTQYESLLDGNSSSASLFNLKLSKKLNLQMGTGLLTGQETYELFKRATLKYQSDTNFDKLPTKFRATATNVLTGEMKVFSEGDLAEAIRASISIPGFFETFEIDGNTYMDGGTSKNLPIKAAKDLGYDIVIAVEISDQLYNDKTQLESNPLMSVLQFYNMTQAFRNKEEYQYADLVIFPDVSEFNILDFPKGRQIYDKSKQEIELYTDKLIEIKKKIYKNKTVDSYDYDEYSKKGYLKLDGFTINGAIESDKKYIQSLYDEMVGKEFNEQAYNNFTNRIYATGNYSKITLRTKKAKAGSIIELNLIQKKPEAIVAFFGGAFEGTFAADASSKLTLFADTQFRNLTGPGSVLSFRIDFLNSFSFSSMYMQPIGPRLFFKLDAAYEMDRDFITSGFTEQTLEGYNLVNADIDAVFGFQFTKNNKLYFGGSYNWLNTSNVNTPALYKQQNLYGNVIAEHAFSINAKYNYSTLNYPVFPSEGIFFSVSGLAAFPILAENTPAIFTPIESDIEIAIPVAKKWSVITSIYGASDFSQNLAKIPSFISYYGFPIGDRRFSPQIASKEDFGIHKLATKMTLQFQPFNQLTILGGQLYFSVYGSIASIWMDYSEISLDNIKWNSAFNCGVRIKSNLSFSIKFGAGTTRNQILPFFAFDFGTLRY